jgi:hypothetical protein
MRLFTITLALALAIGTTACGQTKPKPLNQGVPTKSLCKNWVDMEGQISCGDTPTSDYISITPAPLLDCGNGVAKISLAYAHRLLDDPKLGEHALRAAVLSCETSSADTNPQHNENSFDKQ